MSSEAARWALYNRLREVLGDESADTFVNELANKSDIETLRVELRSDMALLEDRLIAELKDVIARQSKNYYIAIISAMGVLTTIFGVLLASFR